MSVTTPTPNPDATFRFIIAKLGLRFRIWVSGPWGKGLGRRVGMFSVEVFWIGGEGDNH